MRSWRSWRSWRKSTAALVPTALVLAVVAAVVGPASPATARPAWDITPVVVAHNPSPAPRAVNLRWAEHRTFDRVVIDLRGSLPGYRVAYVRTLREQASGDRVPLPGRRHIEIGLHPATAHNRSGDSVYHGPQRQLMQLPVLRGVAFTGDFEGTVSFGLALSRRANFRVTTLQQPTRLVVDLHH